MRATFVGAKVIEVHEDDSSCGNRFIFECELCRSRINHDVFTKDELEKVVRGIKIGLLPDEIECKKCNDNVKYQ